MLHKSQSTLWLHGQVLWCAVAAAMAFCCALCADDGVGKVLGAWVLLAVPTGAFAAWSHRKAMHWAELPAVSPVVLALGLLPLAGQLCLWLLGYIGQPLEVLLVGGMLLAGLGLAALSAWQPFQPLAMMTTLFSTLFAGSISTDRGVLLAVLAYAIGGIGWLTQAHWSSLEGRMQGRRNIRRPIRAPLVALVAILGVLLALGLSPTRRLWSLTGWMPSSGGEDRSDPAARSGVGNGEALVAGAENIQSFGPIEDAPFRQSEEPSLYDLFMDSYEPPIAMKRQDRAIALNEPWEKVCQDHMAKSQVANKEFSTLRQSRPRKPRNDVRSLKSEALFYVKGRTPLHLRQQLFDVFDGVNWIPEPLSKPDQRPVTRLKTIHQRPWLVMESVSRSVDCLGAIDSHAIKVVHLDSNRIPTPLHLLGVHIDRLDDPSFYRLPGHGLVELSVTRLPELTAIQLQSRVQDVRRLSRSATFGSLFNERYRLIPEGEAMTQVLALAKTWTAGIPRGWPQIRAIVQRLREDYTLDPDWRPTTMPDAPFVEFLLESKRGPDYLFATSAAMMLRSLDYSTRLVGGFYASPERYEAQRGHTPVMGADAHVWPEVYFAGGAWLSLEPTPGYELLRPPADWLEQLAAIGLAATRFLWQRPLASFAGAVLLGVLFWQRRWLRDRAALWRWRLVPARSPRLRLLQTMRLLDWRLELAGYARPPGLTPGNWFRRLPGLSPQAVPSLAQFGQWADWALFAPETAAAPGTTATPEDVCRTAERQLDEWRRTHTRQTGLGQRKSSSPAATGKPVSPSAPELPLVQLSGPR